MSVENREAKTVGELIAILSTMPQDADVVGRNPPWGGIKVVPQDSGAILLGEMGSLRDRFPSRIPQPA